MSTYKVEQNLLIAPKSGKVKGLAIFFTDEPKLLKTLEEMPVNLRIRAIQLMKENLKETSLAMLI